jgi:hypothetical protein
LTVLEVDVGSPASPEITEKVEFLIDSGAIYSVVPTPILEKLGIRPLTQQEFRLRDGSKILRKKGLLFTSTGNEPAGRTSSSAKREIVTFSRLSHWGPLDFRWTHCGAS